MLTHKFPFQKKHHRYQTNTSSILAEAVVLPLDLLITVKHEDAGLTRCHWRNSLDDLTNHKRHKTDQISIETCDYDSADSRNGLSGHFSDSCSFDSKTYRSSNGLLEIPCLIASKGLPSHCPGILHCTSECKPPSKVLLEFGPESFCKYTVLKVGGCYLLEYQEEYKLLSTKGNHKLEGSKLLINSYTNLRSLNFSSIDGLQSSDVSNVYCFSKFGPNSGIGISKGFEIPIPNRNDIGPHESYFDINVFVAAGALKMLLNRIKVLSTGPFESKDSLKEESDICVHHGPRITQSSGHSCIDNPLPAGNLITLNGLVVGLHDCDGDALPERSRLLPCKGSLPMFLQGNGGICVHLLVEDCMVLIFCDLSKQAHHPIGLGQDVYATFHRILVLSDLNKYMMLPVSFITVKNVCLVKGHTDAEFNNTLASSGLDCVAFPNTVAAELIHDVLESSLLEPRQFRCRVVAVYLLEVERTSQAKVLQSSGHTQLPLFGIPLVGFIMDDGSSSFCCWSESDKAATMLGLNSEHFLGLSPENLGNGKTGTRLAHGSLVSRVNQILEQHGRVVVKNYGSIVDSSCQDLAFSSGSDKSISISSEDILMSLVISPSGTFWTVTGSFMKQEASSWLANRLSVLGMALPSVPNVWATNVCRTDVLSEARSILRELA